MRLTTVPRLIAGFATLAVASTALAMPASAADRFDVDRSVLADFAADHSPGRYTAADLVAEEGIDDFEAIADDACAEAGPTPNSNLILFDFVDSGVGPAVFLVSADVNTDDEISNYERTCTFAVLLTDAGTSMNGSLSFTVSSDFPEGAEQPIDQPATIAAPFSGGDTFGIGPIFTTVTEYAIATFSASGSQLTPSQHVVKKKISTPKSTKQKKAAKKKYTKALTKAKKAYAKAGKTKKAKKTMKKKIAAAKKAYKKATATFKYVNRLEAYTAATPFALNATLDGADDVRPSS